MSKKEIKANTTKTESDYAEFDKNEVERIKKSKGGKK